MPSYGDEMERGFYLHNGGYYFAINDYVDLAVTGEIYTKGTWGIGAQSNYRKRYKFSGHFNFITLILFLGTKGYPIIQYRKTSALVGHILRIQKQICIARCRQA